MMAIQGQKDLTHSVHKLITEYEDGRDWLKVNPLEVSEGSGDIEDIKHCIPQAQILSETRSYKLM